MHRDTGVEALLSLAHGIWDLLKGVYNTDEGRKELEGDFSSQPWQEIKFQIFFFRMWSLGLSLTRWRKVA